ncbi:MAG TPA: 4-(cytidine 5'-diphospho)-2-C-methyl-D-erythritol kinase [Chloroflexota bacterium]|nr:4-(cytidine 5'-diphospho)-2-C-methyl-D-erythritol kinase [Chloroflexota bacterium]
MPGGTMLRVLAPAKVNLGLEIVGRRPDGYHDLVTILQEIELADCLTFAEGATLSVQSNRPRLANDPRNLVLRAATLLRESAGVQSGAQIYLEKKIPVAAGLGGGSSDAAATLLALNRLWNVGWSEAQLTNVARRLGADVAFFLRGGTQLATGLGDALDPLPTPRLWVVVVVVPSPYADKTRELYAALSPADWSDGREVRGLAEALRAGDSIQRRPLPSGFARVTAALFPAVSTAFEAMRRAGAVPSLCGAGPAVLSLHDDASDARYVAERLRAHSVETWMGETRVHSEQSAHS